MGTTLRVTSTESHVLRLQRSRQATDQSHCHWQGFTAMSIARSKRGDRTCFRSCAYLIDCQNHR
eukprot:11215158-Lingulodinium_polyedra.AAC.1